MKNINQSTPVMITGATGYVAGWIVKKLLDEGHTVHAPIRSPENKEKTKYLDQLAAKSKGNIKYFKADLLQDGSYQEAMKGCELVIHTASPFIANVKNPQRDLVDPAVNGTKNILNSVNKTSSVKRVVLTSSCVSIIGDSKDTLAYPNNTATEKNWNTTSTLQHNTYGYSKVMAEKAAWDINKNQNQWDLVVVNPSFVLGPGINPNGTSESFNYVKALGDGQMKAGTFDMNMGCVDVRDLAAAHYKAGFTPEANGRNIISSENLSFLELGQMLRQNFGDTFPFPKKTLPKWLVWLVGPMQGVKREFVSKNIGYPWKVDHSKSVRELKMQYRPVNESVTDFFQQMIDEGIVKSK